MPNIKAEIDPKDIIIAAINLGYIIGLLKGQAGELPDVVESKKDLMILEALDRADRLKKFLTSLVPPEHPELETRA